MRSIEKNDNGILLIIEINLRKISSLNSFFNLMKSEFELPGYFNYSLDSLDECMRDLSWINESNVKIIVNNIDALKEKSAKLYSDIQECFLTYKEYWSNENIKKSKHIVIQY